MSRPYRRAGRIASRARRGAPRGGRPTRKRSTRRGQPMLIGAVVGAAAVAAVMTLFTAPTPVEAPPSAAPRAFVSPTGLFVDPDSPAAKQVEQWQAEGRGDDARRVGEIAAQPMPAWVSAPTGEAGAEVAAYVQRAIAAGQRPFIVIRHIPGLDCGKGQGGARDAADYRAWIREVSGGLGGHEATIILEPDAVPHELSGCVKGATKVRERQTLLADAVKVLKDAAPVTLYLDAGNPGFVTDVVKLADALQRSGLEKADGFSLNVGNFYPTADVVTYGRKLSAKAADKHFVIDTGRNGKGRAEGEKATGATAPCNPPGRGIGETPTTETGEPLVDAYLWIKRVGESDGACRPGEPAAGKWWPDYALGLVSNT